MADGGAVGPGVSSQAGSCSLEVCSKLHTSAGVLLYNGHTVRCIHLSRVLHKQIVHYFFFSFSLRDNNVFTLKLSPSKL